MTTSTQDAIAAFLAKGGKVAKVAPDATCGMTARDFYKAARDEVVVRVVRDFGAEELEIETAREENGYYKS